MIRLHQKSVFLILTGVMLFASGCQGTLAPQLGGLDNPGFMALWGTYTHCKASSQIDDLRIDVRQLSEATGNRERNKGFRLPLPSQIDRLINTPTDRYAVDVRAMASACSLHAGQLALDRGRVDLARDMFSSVVALHPQDDSSYYLLQAKALLSDLDKGIDLSFKKP